MDLLMAALELLAIIAFILFVLQFFRGFIIWMLGLDKIEKHLSEIEIILRRERK